MLRSESCIALTGATGLIGRRLVPALAAARLPARALMRPGGSVDHATPVFGTMLDVAALQRLVHGADTVIHMAGVAHTALRNAADEQAARQVNVDGTQQLVEAAKSEGVRHFVLMSSAHVYVGQTGVNLSEESPVEGDTAYGAMKLEAESIALAAASHRMRVTVLRPCLTYGPGVRFNLQSLLRAIRKRYYVHVRSGGVIRSMASVDTVAAAILHLIDTEGQSTIFNVADRSPIVLEDWVNHLADLMQQKHPHTVPYGAMKFAASLGSVLRALGLPAPITRNSLRKLTSSFSISTDRLAATGFAWPETRETVLREMISAEFLSASARKG